MNNTTTKEFLWKVIIRYNAFLDIFFDGLDGVSIPQPQHEVSLFARSYFWNSIDLHICIFIILQLTFAFNYLRSQIHIQKMLNLRNDYNLKLKKKWYDFYNTGDIIQKLHFIIFYLIYSFLN